MYSCLQNISNTFGNAGKGTASRPLRRTVLLDTDGTIVLGQDQDAPADVYDAAESLRCVAAVAVK